MRLYQKCIIIGICTFIASFLLLVTGQKTTNSVYLWDETKVDLLAEIDKDSLVIKIDEGYEMTQVFYPKEFKVGYIKSEYLKGITDDFVKEVIYSLQR